MEANFTRCLPEILRHEGGWADHPADPGGATMKGITIGTYAQWKGRKVTKAELRAISAAEVAAIYKRNYWDKVRGDDLPAGLDLVAFDAAVNSGPSRGAKWLQQAIGVTADGKVGPETIKAAWKVDAAYTVGRALDIRLAFLRSLKTWGTFGKGWSRRVAGVRKVALEMVAAHHVRETPKTEHEPPVMSKTAPVSVARPGKSPPIKKAAPAKTGSGSAGFLLGGLLVLIGAKIDALSAWASGWAHWAASFFN